MFGGCAGLFSGFDGGFDWALVVLMGFLVVLMDGVFGGFAGLFSGFDGGFDWVLVVLMGFSVVLMGL